MLQSGHQPCTDRPGVAPLPWQRPSAVSLRPFAAFTRGRAAPQSLGRLRHNQTAQRQPFRRRLRPSVISIDSLKTTQQ